MIYVKVIPVHIDITTRDETSFAEATNPQKVGSLYEVGRVAALGPGRRGGGQVVLI